MKILFKEIAKKLKDSCVGYSDRDQALIHEATEQLKMANDIWVFYKNRGLERDKEIDFLKAQLQALKNFIEHGKSL